MQYPVVFVVVIIFAILSSSPHYFVAAITIITQSCRRPRLSLPLLLCNAERIGDR
jgi:hypothetical protein